MSGVNWKSLFRVLRLLTFGIIIILSILLGAYLDTKNNLYLNNDLIEKLMDAGKYLIAALASGTLALSGVFLTLKFQERQRQDDYDKWYAEFFLVRKFQAFEDFKGSMLSAYEELASYFLNRNWPHTSELRNELRRKMEETIRASEKAQTYLSREEAIRLRELLHVMIDVQTYVLNPQQYTSPAEQSLNESVEEVRILINQKLNPDILSRFEARFLENISTRSV